MKRALITGISGQDGSYMAEYLLGLGYEVWGFVRREPETMRWLQPVRHRIELVYGDLRDGESLGVGFQKAWPDEIYNLAGQVFVPTSWDFPAETFDINVGGLSRLLQIIERTKRDTRLYQASSSEMVGNWNGLCNERANAAPADITLWNLQIGGASAGGGLPGARLVRCRRHPVQSRVSSPRPRNGDPQDHQSRGAVGDG
jgi:GDP-D-mannose dehydratase